MEVFDMDQTRATISVCMRGLLVFEPSYHYTFFFFKYHYSFNFQLKTYNTLVLRFSKNLLVLVFVSSSLWARYFCNLSLRVWMVCMLEEKIFIYIQLDPLFFFFLFSNKFFFLGRKRCSYKLEKKNYKWKKTFYVGPVQIKRNFFFL